MVVVVVEVAVVDRVAVAVHSVVVEVVEEVEAMAALEGMIRFVSSHITAYSASSVGQQMALLTRFRYRGGYRSRGRGYSPY